MNKNIIKRISISLTFLLIGIITYYIFNTGLICKSNLILSLIRNYLSDFCWTVSFFLICIIFTSNITKKSLIINSIYVIVIASIFELLQYLKIVKGTFDIIDICVYILSTMTAYLIELLIRRKENEKI